jgi:predicted nucleic acid-binding protein
VRIFVDTSAFYALLDADAPEYFSAIQIWQNLLSQPGQLYTTNYNVVETVALVQKRLGIAAVQSLHQDILPLLHVHWVDEHLHRTSVDALLIANRRQLSLVDCVSFAACHLLAIDRVFAYDRHFEQQGFRLLI